MERAEPGEGNLDELWIQCNSPDGRLKACSWPRCLAPNPGPRRMLAYAQWLWWKVLTGITSIPNGWD